MQGGHHLQLSFKGKGIAPGVAAMGLRMIETGPLRRRQQSGFRRIPHQTLMVAGSGIAAEQTGQEQLA